MIYAKLKPDNTFDHAVSNVNTVWDANNYCTPEALIKDGKANQFSVVELHETPKPTFNAATQTCIQVGAEIVDGSWKTKWLVSDMTPEEIEAKRQASIPKVVSMRQARLALYGAGLLGQVDMLVSSSTPDVQIEWEFAADLRRDWPTLLALSAALGLTNEQVDNLFIQASQL